MSDSEYVTSSAWVRQVGRPDLIDEVADGFERPAAVASQSFWSASDGTRWPRSSRGWRSRDLMGRQRALERRAG